LNETNFFKSFNFNILKFNKYHLTDNTKTPIGCHYFGCIIKGSAKIKTQEAELLLHPDEIFYFPKGLKYQSQWFGENENDVIFYSFGFEISPINKSFVLQKINCNNTAKELFKDLCANISNKEKSIGILYHFFGEVADCMQQAKKGHINPTVEKAIEYINQNPNIKISKLAKNCDISESGIYLLFKKYTGKTPNDIRLEILCDKAVTLLTTTNKTIQEISDTLGFSSTSYFRKIFKTHTGKAPLQIRKESAF